MEMHLKHDIIIVGAGITGLTAAVYLKKKGYDVVVIEKNNKAGGVIGTVSENGFTFETGPNTGVLGNPEIAELFEELAPKAKLQTADAKSEKRLILKNGKWHALPSGLASAVTTPLFTVSDKIRVLFEPFRKKGNNPFESVADLVKRRLGKSFLDYAVDPFISGIYAGNPNNLITKFALPKLYNLEQNYGSFIKGAFAKMKEPKSERDKKATKKVFSAQGGLQNIIDAAVEKIGVEKFLFTCAQTIISKNNNLFEADIKLNNGQSVKIYAEKLITTFGGNELKSILSFVDEKDLEPILNLKYAKVIQFVAGYNKWTGSDIKAFGGLVPTAEKRNVLGILFPSSIFPQRAPENGALLSVFMGGINRPDLFDKSDDEITQIAISEINSTLNVNKNPDLIKIFKYSAAIPQYEKSSAERFEAIEKIQNKHKGLILAGNIRNGIGMADRVKQAVDIANEF